MAVAVVVMIYGAAWTLGVHAIRADAERTRMLALSGGLLVAVWANFSLIAVLGTPQQATAAENMIRYPLILIDALAIAGGFALLRETLCDAGERFYSMLGFAAIMLASPLYVIFAATQYQVYRTIAGSGSLPPGMDSLDELSLILLFVGALLSYLATAAFATALGRVQLLGRTASRTFNALSLGAALCAAMRVAEALGAAENPIWGFKHWYTLPGFALLIPAVPWIIPCLIGFFLLRRAGSAPETGTAK
jgi:hypothetical protein